MKLEDIGFYTLFDARAFERSYSSPMCRCELILTDRCNFHCPYCRRLRKECRGDMNLSFAQYVLSLWVKDGLQNIRFSGGEPTLYPHLKALVKGCKNFGCDRIAISTNGSADFDFYKELIEDGLNDLSISLDACCASVAKIMTGKNGYYKKIINNIERLSAMTYVTVGMVVTNSNIDDVGKVIELAHNLGVADIRLIPAAQGNLRISAYELPLNYCENHPILKYRINRLKHNLPFRGLKKTDSHKCSLLYDDSVVVGRWHFPCIIYLREGGNPIGKVGPEMRQERIQWLEGTDTYKEPICRKNCLDVCIDFNNKTAGIR